MNKNNSSRNPKPGSKPKAKRVSSAKGGELDTASKHGQTFRGTLDVTRSGTGFVSVEGQEQDILVHRENMRTALNGDTVIVALSKVSRQGRQEGVIKDIVHRRQSEFSGKIEVHEHFAFFIGEGNGTAPDIYISKEDLNGATDGDRVVARVTDWAEKKKNPVGEVVRILTGESANEIAMQGILMEAGFQLDFPDNVMEEAARFTDVIDPAELQKRRDMRQTLMLTIDPVDAKDFDDAISYKKLENGLYEIGIHIADVSFFVRPGSDLDNEAYNRATSVYLPDRVLPMLPEHLSNGLCSLRPDEDKYAFSAIFQMDDAGHVKDYWLGRTVIRSARRFTYEEVQEIIEGAEGDHKEVVLHLNKIAQSLRAERFKKGAINFSSKEVRFRLDEEARPVEVVVKESKESHQLVEEFMLIANRTVAKHVGAILYQDKPLPFPYRVHDSPDESKLAQFAAFASRYGHEFDTQSPEAISKSFNELLAQAAGKPEQQVLESLGIRTMAKAVYTTENIGHYGLGFEFYCHFTSPIRRYPDVMVHRVLQEVLDGKAKPTKGLEQRSKHCSDRERAAMEAERAANKYKQVEFMQPFVGEEFEAVISGVSQYGFWAETVAHKCEGMVKMEDLSAIDQFEAPEGEYALVGRHTGLRFRMGDAVKVRLVATSLEKRTIDFELAELPPTPKQQGQEGRNAKPVTRKDPKSAGRKALSAKGGKAPAKRKK
jgi:ribonuclease R